MIESNQKGTRISFQFPPSANSTPKSENVVDQESTDQPAQIAR
jgi:hypothetical protein